MSNERNIYLNHDKSVLLSNSREMSLKKFLNLTQAEKNLYNKSFNKLKFPLCYFLQEFNKVARIWKIYSMR